MGIARLYSLNVQWFSVFDTTRSTLGYPRQNKLRILEKEPTKYPKLGLFALRIPHLESDGILEFSWRPVSILGKHQRGESRSGGSDDPFVPPALHLSHRRAAEFPRQYL